MGRVGYFLFSFEVWNPFLLEFASSLTFHLANIGHMKLYIHDCIKGMGSSLIVKGHLSSQLQLNHQHFCRWELSLV